MSQDRRMEYLDHRRIIYRTIPQSEPTTKYPWGMYFEEGTYECYDLFRRHDNNQYMDIGSSLGPLLQLEGWKSSRTYLLAYWGNVDHPVLHEEDVWG